MTTKNLYRVDCIIIGAGIFGLHAARILAKKNKKVLILEKSLRAFSGASAINQARVHNGYHYPRSYDTAKKVADYYERFTNDFSFAMNDSFEHIYAIASNDSKISPDGFIDFCEAVNIPLRKVDSSDYFRDGLSTAAFIVEECSFDPDRIRDFLLEEIKGRAQIMYGVGIVNVEKKKF